jgi:hypothetical protein
MYFNTLLTARISDFMPPDFWLFAALKKHLNKIHVACDGELQGKMVLRTA